MIGRLRGEIVVKQPPMLLVDVNGVGYELEAPMSTFYELGAAGTQVTLFTHLQVREDAHTLYAFVSEAERSLFRSLLKVSGVGAKMALAILSGMNAAEFGRCVQAGDAAALTRLPGIGKKTAERLIIEMRDRIEAPGEVALTPTGGTPVSDPVEDAVHALISLGYRPADASRMVSAVEAADLGSEEIIRQALRATLNR
ncbi:MAG: Holliday junction branch migration protein RuvA [Gammaproteobacteria bacterium]|jgi:Holliday junction DNA helicase RuvA